MRIVSGVLCSVVMLIACRSDSWQNLGALSTATPTVVLVNYATPTATPRPAKPRAVEPTQNPTNIPETSPGPTDDSATVLPVPEEEDNGREPTFQPPVATTGPTAAATPTALLPPPPTAIPTATSISTPAPLVGRIAFPVDDGGGHYDVWVVELPGGEPFLVQARARQPSFSKDGRLLVKAQANNLGESIALLDSTYTWLGIINESPDDAYPFWHPDGTRYAYSNANLVLDPATAHLAPYIFTACSLQIPRFEANIKCQDFRQWGKVVIGEAPVWTEDDRLAYFSYKGDDGIYFVENASVLREAGGLGPQQLLVRGNGRPTDTAGFQVFFSAGDIDGNWEAYAVDLDGSNLINLSNAPLFQDGLPTVSPEGNWVAFVSDRDGKWGIWAVPRTGGEATKVADLSKINTNPSPWGIGDRAWMTERISWGP